MLPGITRAAVLELAERDGIRVGGAAIDVGQLLEADEVFLTNSVMGVMPVTRIERHTLGDGSPGAMTTRLSEAYAATVAEATA